MAFSRVNFTFTFNVVLSNKRKMDVTFRVPFVFQLHIRIVSLHIVISRQPH
jgi:hypothetical protein